MDSKELDKKERKRLYAIQYRKENAERINARHNFRLENDSDYALRYKAKQEKRKHLYQETHIEAVKLRNEARTARAIVRETAEKERQRKQKAKERSENREEYNAYIREYNKKNRDVVNAGRRFRWNNDLKYRSKMFYGVIKSKYDLTQEQYANLYILQNGKCFICNCSELEAGEKGLVIDHCHATNKIRGLLCKDCNIALGSVKDNIKNLERAIAYLNKYRKE